MVGEYDHEEVPGSGGSAPTDRTKAAAKFGAGDVARPFFSEVRTGDPATRYECDPDDTSLVEVAKPILRDLATQLRMEPVSVLLYDADGVIQLRHTGNRQLADALDRLRLAPGFSLAERAVDATDTDTKLKSGGSAQFLGHQHFVENLENFACAGIPVQHPVTREVLGGVVLTCPRSDTWLTVFPAVATFALLHDYLLTCRRHHGAVLAASDALLIMNDEVQKLLSPSDQASLLTVVLKATSSGCGQQLTIDLPSGATARVQCRPCIAGPGTSGVVQVQLVPQVVGPKERQLANAHTPPPTVVGSSALWMQCRQVVDRYFQAREWLILEGEPGTGKVALARAIHQCRAPAAHLPTLDADDYGPGWIAEVVEELETGTGTLVLTHLDRLTLEAVAALADALESHSDSTAPNRPWVVGTVTHCGREHSTGLAGLLALFPRTVKVPPLRHHSEDIAELVPHLLARFTRGRTLKCSPEAMHMLACSRWPGNVEQLHQVLRSVAAKSRIGTIEMGDLPPECQVTTRRVLTPLEAIECDAIIDALLKTNGDRANAARLLGMSRATIYRKVRDYGLTLPSPGHS